MKNKSYSKEQAKEARKPVTTPSIGSNKDALKIRCSRILSICLFVGLLIAIAFIFVFNYAERSGIKGLVDGYEPNSGLAQTHP